MTSTHNPTERRYEMTRKIASRSAAVALLVLGALTSVAQAEPVELTEAQMDQVTAGAFYAVNGRYLIKDGSPTDPWARTFRLYADGYYRDNNSGKRWLPIDLYFADDGHAYGRLGMVSDVTNTVVHTIWGSQQGRYGVPVYSNNGAIIGYKGYWQ
jgi:hypothetical protein